MFIHYFSTNLHNYGSLIHYLCNVLVSALRQIDYDMTNPLNHTSYIGLMHFKMETIKQHPP